VPTRERKSTRRDGKKVGALFLVTPRALHVLMVAVMQRRPEKAPLHLNQVLKSSNLGDVGTDQLRRLLVDVTLSTICVILLEMSKGRSRRNWIHVVVAVIMKRDVHKGIIGQSKDNVTDVVWFGFIQFDKDRIHATLIFVGVVLRLG
jgi:hypothetical protein